MKCTTTLAICMFCSCVALSQEFPNGGQVFKREVFNKLQFVTSSKAETQLPRSVDLRPYTPKVAGQSYGTCYSYASAYSGRTTLYNIKMKETVNTTENAFSPGFIQTLIWGAKKRKCKNRGGDANEACLLMMNVGVLPLKEYAVDCSGEEISEQMKTKASNYKIMAKELFDICASKEIKKNRIKSSLSDMKPVVIGINSVSSFHNKGGDSTLWTPTPAEKKLANCNRANHAVCIVAYDDDKFDGAFEIMNSWGSKWKGDGFVWVKYEDLIDYVMFAVELSEL